MNVRHNRLRVRRKPAVSRFPLPPLLAVGMAVGYAIGCCFGANAALPEPSNPVLSFFEQQRRGWDAVRRLAAGAVRLVRLRFRVFAAVYVVSWFLLIPAVFGIKGFLSACTAAAFLNSGCDHAFCLSCVAVGLPGIFLVPALFLLGTLCAQMSVRLLEQRRGLPVPVSSERYSRELALVFCLLLAAAAAACYAVPFFTRLIL